MIYLKEKEVLMAKQKVPIKHYQELSKLFPEVFSALENLGSAIREAGPLTEKTVELIQLAGAAASQMEGSVHSHTRRALKSGASPEEIYQTLILLMSTIGFPKVSSSIMWAQDVLKGKKKKR
jgi:4-carboxymuconolactone decarboxylase